MHEQQTAFENIVGKEEIALNEQFLLSPKMFLLNQTNSSLFVHIFDIISLFAAELEEPNIGIWGKGLIQVVSNTGLTVLENIMGKGENAGNHYFLLFRQWVLLSPCRKNPATLVFFCLPSANVSNLDQTKILLFGKEYI